MHLFDRLACGPCLDGPQLQALHENIGRIEGAGADRHAADVEVMHVDAEEADHLVAVPAGVDRRVHHRIVEMLPLHGRMVAEDEVAVLQPVQPVDVEPIDHRAADAVGDECRDAFLALGDEIAVGADEGDRVIAIFGDVMAECHAGDIGLDLIGDGDDAVAQHLDGDQISGSMASDLGGCDVHCMTVSWVWQVSLISCR